MRRRSRADSALSAASNLFLGGTLLLGFLFGGFPLSFEVSLRLLNALSGFPSLVSGVFDLFEDSVVGSVGHGAV
jgi:hypothetical protein